MDGNIINFFRLSLRICVWPLLYLHRPLWKCFCN
uniref:Uncharacterized protein n=1 Tax=Rhizophora mucronata TaxID=61149 RepID=A0A2P2Q6X7_RHIMU